MKMFVVCVRDSAVDSFLQPWVSDSLGGAVRAFGDEVLRSGDDSPITKHPEDYELFHVGYFDRQSGRRAGFSGPCSGKPSGTLPEVCPR